MFSVALVVLPLFIRLATALENGTVSAMEARQNCGTYTVPNVPGGFTTRQIIDFSSATSGQNTQQVLSNHGLYISNWPIPDTPPRIPHTFTPNNVKLVNGALSLKVSAYSGSGNILSAEIGTMAEFRYGSVRTVQRSSSTPGVCEGNFFYKDGQGEIDFEILTSTIDTSSACVPKGIWATTHAPNQSPVSQTYQFTFNPRTAFHEYRIDWSPTAARYYIDGVFKGQITQNIPQVAGQWLWNAWSNGDPCWSAGPPTADSTTLIQKITIYKDYVTSTSGTVCPV